MAKDKKVKQKQEAIIIDIHGTLINKDGSINENLCNIVRCLAKSYYILLLTSHNYNKKQDLVDEIDYIDIVPDGLFYNTGATSKHDDIVKKHIYNKDIEPYYDVVNVIDNNKSVIRMFRKQGIDTMRFKIGN